MQISPGSVRTFPVSCTTPHNRRQVYTRCFHRLYPRDDFAPPLRRLHNYQVCPEHIRMKTHPHMACDRVYAVSGRNKLIGLFLSSLICAKAVTGYYFISGLRTNGTFTVRYSLAHSSCSILAVPLPDIQIAAFKTCTAVGSFRVQISPHAIGAVFGGLLTPSSPLPAAHGRFRQTFAHSRLLSGLRVPMSPLSGFLPY
jgi:hypothetical protein